MDELTTYNSGILLKDAIFKFAKLELLEKYKGIAIVEPQLKATSLLEAITEGLQGFHAIGAAQNQRSAILIEIKSDITARIQNSELMALGLELPITPLTKPTQIPAHLFSGDINWENSELVFKNLAYSGIKLLKAGINENQDSWSVQLKDEIKAQQLSDLDPAAHIDEKEAAKFLGISPRTLQGYRIKGGGPDFIKIGKSVRYKIGYLIQWSENYKRSNTIS